jgi:hypothetical protein
MATVTSSILLQDLVNAGKLNINKNSSVGTIKGAIRARLNRDFPQLGLDVFNDISVKLKGTHVQIIVPVDKDRNFGANDIRRSVL